MYAGRIISYYANNGHISEIYFYRPSYLLQKSVDMLLHYVTAGKLIRADNNRHWVDIGISLYKSDNFSFAYNCVFQ
jgi:hypothetical protein